MKEKCSEQDIYFIMGADSLFHLETWKSADKILSLCHIIAAPRISQSTSEIESQIDYLMAKYEYIVWLKLNIII